MAESPRPQTGSRSFTSSCRTTSSAPAACYDEWSARGAEFLTPPIPRETEIRCYIRDPDGYLIEVGQTTRPPGPVGSSR